ncbi:acyl carrier protein [Kitasatospora phosalacinea]|uniref:Acyl carrier protein n=1 Tax=Kitasatospora phosalacinea TaxID=2065 RepID=A0ABW6GKF1_9ACTN
MQERVREFVIASITAMNYDVDRITGDTDLGPTGIGLESLALAELSVRVEDEFGVKFELEEMGTTALMTLDQFTADVTRRIAAAAPGSADATDTTDATGTARSGDTARTTGTAA